MNKRPLIQAIIASLNESLQVLEKAARASHAEATHESSKAENKYDTRGLEAAYLAGGQSRQAKEISECIATYAALSIHDFAPNETIDLTALVELEVDRHLSTYFVGPKSGGLEIHYQNMEVFVITPQSPLGKTLMGKKTGQRWKAKMGGVLSNYYIVSVSWTNAVSSA